MEVFLNKYKWLDEANIFNKKNDRIPPKWLEENADILVLYFSTNEIDKNGIIEKFYEIYENVKFVNIPIEVINVPMDDTEEDMKKCYEKQANWFTLMFDDPLVHVLKYMFEITSTPHLLVLKYDGTIISRHGVLDLEEHGKDAVLTWLTNERLMTKSRNFSKEYSMYGDKWNYLSVDPSKQLHAEYSRKFSNVLEAAEEKQYIKKDTKQVSPSEKRM